MLLPWLQYVETPNTHSPNEVCFCGKTVATHAMVTALQKNTHNNMENLLQSFSGNILYFVMLRLNI